MNEQEAQNILEEATFEYSIGENQSAIKRLKAATSDAPENASLWHALAEMLCSEKLLDESLKCANKALEIIPDDLHLHTTLSRIWVQLGDKEKAEEHGNKAKLLSWKEQLKEPPTEAPS